MHRQLTFRRLIACILLPTYLTACVTWQAQETSPEQLLAEEQPDKVLVKLADGSKLVLEQPVIVGDSLVGLEQGEERSIPLTSALAFEVRKTDADLTAWSVLGGVVVLGGLIFVAACWASECVGGGGIGGVGGT
jgi:hypothetical protein